MNLLVGCWMRLTDVCLFNNFILNDRQTVDRFPLDKPLKSVVMSWGGNPTVIRVLRRVCLPFTITKSSWTGFHAITQIQHSHPFKHIALLPPKKLGGVG